jgi:uncharacterized integral membrane protein
MRALLWAFRIFIFCFLFVFALKNTELVNLRFLFDTVWQAPLVMVVLIFFTGGALVGALALLGTVFSLRREVARLDRELKLAQSAATNYPAIIQPPPAQ